MTKKEKLGEEFISFGVNILESMGLDRVTSKIYWLLFIEPEEMSIEEIARKTGYSLASVSIKMRLLLGIGMVQRIQKPGTKKAYYYAEKSIFKMYKKKLEIWYEKEVKPAKESLPSLIKKYRARASGDKEKKQLEIIEGYYKDILKLESIFKEMEEKFDRAL